MSNQSHNAISPRRFWNEIEKQADGNLTDPSAAALFSVLSEVPTRSTLGAAICDYLSSHPRNNLSEHVNMVRSTIVMYTIQSGGEIPGTQEQWREQITNIEHDLNAHTNNQLAEGGRGRVEQLFVTLELNARSLQTNVASRYNTVEFLSQVMAHRFSRGVSIADVGCSAMQGLNMLAMKDEYGIEPVRVYGPTGKVSNKYTSRYNQIISGPSAFRFGIGIDAHPVISEHDLTWNKANLRLAELRDPQFMEQYNRLASVNPTNVTFEWKDFSSKGDIQDLQDKYKHDKPNIFTFLTMLYQLNPDERTIALSSVPDLISENGLVIVQDAARPTGPELKDIQITGDNWHDDNEEPYCTMVYDMQNPGLGWQIIAYGIKGSRFNRIRLGAGKLAVRGELMNAAEYLDRQIPRRQEL